MSTDVDDCTRVHVRRNELIVYRLKTSVKSGLRSENRRSHSPMSMVENEAPMYGFTNMLELSYR